MAFQLGQKRPMTFEDAPSKAANTGGGQDGTQGWTCDKCGNFNHPGRMYCNMRKCQAPGPWQCPLCGNQNYASRQVCNRRACGAPRPPPPGGGMGGGKGGAAPMQMQQAVNTILSVPSIAQLPGFAQVLQNVVGTVGAMPSPMGRGMGPASQGQQKYPEGSWKCLSCGNVNYPLRDSCNSPKCGLPRAQIDGGPPDSIAGPGPGSGSSREPPEGSWVCMMCQNINWPTRETCNRKSCGAQRFHADGGTPLPGQKQPPKGFSPSQAELASTQQAAPGPPIFHGQPGQSNMMGGMMGGMGMMGNQMGRNKPSKWDMRG
eukprot:gnl/MRDRNA2_/MRDRNA2_56948_c0_seq1.p1 gnl/MRDRNA2_/MRDRNA2_56948_c0~~gnl/MRDRNA2_/MRDRNA2_56948_c0_seq1.p1  ORF type:complete len:316 (-),score=47.28 gnl/MRDRNA2_/MRDRNA2_56948_c0_seq1:327-1274(-)